MRSRPVAGTTLIDKDAGKVDFAVRQLVSLAVGHEVLRHNRLASRRGASGAREGGSGVAPYLSSGGAYSDNWQTACRARRSTSRAKVAPEPRSVWNHRLTTRICVSATAGGLVRSGDSDLKYRLSDRYVEVEAQWTGLTAGCSSSATRSTTTWRRRLSLPWATPPNCFPTKVVRRA